MGSKLNEEIPILLPEVGEQTCTNRPEQSLVTVLSYVTGQECRHGPTLLMLPY